MADLFTPELLAPAGNEESLRAALAAGADAVYFGATDFSNRMRAKNFTRETIGDAIRLCHSVGAAAHITVNIRVRDREVADVLALADVLLGGEPDSRADALIVADLGAAAVIRQAYPNAVLHASTQTSLLSPADCEALKENGFSRLVVPRELSLDEIASLVKSSPIEIEMFLHGAHCVSCSGQCLLSYVMGGRSGNRGECAQPCRLPYTVSTDGREVGGSYPLSMADMYLGGHITDLLSSGVASLKIEGRLKSPAYVFGVTSVYRTLLDERRNATPEERAALEALFTRGFTDGYLTHRYAMMSGQKSAGESATTVQGAVKAAFDARKKAHAVAKAEAEAAKVREGLTKVTAQFAASLNRPTELSLSVGEHRVTVQGEPPSPSTGNPLTPERIAQNLIKFGKSAFVLSPDDIAFTVDEGVWMPLSAINELRRRALSALTDELGIPAEPTQNVPEKRTPSVLPPLPTLAETEKAAQKPEKTAELFSLAHFLAGSTPERQSERLNAVLASFDRLYVPLADAESARTLAETSDKLALVLPMYTPSDERLSVALRDAQRIGYRRVMCHTVGQIRITRSLGMTADLSFRGNVTNAYAAGVYAKSGVASVMLSPEMAPPLGRDIANTCPVPVGVIGYGRMPVMHLSRCVISGGKCRKGNDGGRISDREPKPHVCLAQMTDRLGESFPILGLSDCTNAVFNSTVTWMGDRATEATLFGTAGFVHFLFTDERAEEAVDVAAAYDRHEKRKGRRL